jgi:hypothetical protein
VKRSLRPVMGRGARKQLLMHSVGSQQPAAKKQKAADKKKEGDPPLTSLSPEHTEEGASGKGEKPREKVEGSANKKSKSELVKRAAEEGTKPAHCAKRGHSDCSHSTGGIVGTNSLDHGDLYASYWVCPTSQGCVMLTVGQDEVEVEGSHKKAAGKASTEKGSAARKDKGPTRGCVF